MFYCANKEETKNGEQKKKLSTLKRAIK